MDDLKDLLEILPEEPEKKLREWAFLQNGDLLGGELCLFRRESVELYPEDQGWPLPAPERVQNKRVWGARCSCTACGEDFVAGYGSAKQGGMKIKGIRLLCDDAEQLWPGIPEQEDDIWDRSAAEIAEGEALSCPYCGAEVRLIHAGSLRGGRTWQLLLCQAAVLAGRLVLLRAARDKADEEARQAREAARQAEAARDEAKRRLALANPDAAVFAALYGQVQEDWNKLHGAWIKAAAADAATGEKLRTAARALAEKWRKEEW